MKMVERIARLLCEREGGDPDEIRQGEGKAVGQSWTGWQAYASDAEVLLAALRRPAEPVDRSRYTVIPYENETSEGSNDVWLVIDETRPKPRIGHNPVCESFEEDDARMIAAALNRP